jgi:hypothetical protein
MERTPNGTLMLWLPGHDWIVLEVVDRYGQRIYPNPVATDTSQARIDDRLKHYSTKRAIDGAAWLQAYDRLLGRWCEHGVSASICTICSTPGADYA